MMTNVANDGSSQNNNEVFWAQIALTWFDLGSAVQGLA